MTVSTEISSNEYTGNGVTTDFDYKFRIFKANDLSVITSDSGGDNVVTLRLGTDYTVTGANKSTGGKVILTKPLADKHQISIARDIPIKQETSFRNQSKFLAETHEDAFDYLTMLIQRIWGSLGSLYLKRPSILANWFDAKGYRISNIGSAKNNNDAVNFELLNSRSSKSLRVSDTEISSFPNVSDRKNKQIGFDEFGNTTLLNPSETGSLGYVPIDSFEKGASITGRYQILYWELKNEYYRWDGSLNKQVPAGSTPQSTGGIGKGAWMLIVINDHSKLINRSSLDAHPTSSITSGSEGLNKFVARTSNYDRRVNPTKVVGNSDLIYPISNNRKPKLVILLGQSNAEGRATTADANKYDDKTGTRPSVKIWTDSGFSDLHIPRNSNDSLQNNDALKGRFGIELALANYAEIDEKTLYLVKSTEGGTFMGQWLANEDVIPMQDPSNANDPADDGNLNAATPAQGILDDRAWAKVQAAISEMDAKFGASGYEKVLVMMQGEANGSSPTQFPRFKRQRKTFINRWKNRLGNNIRIITPHILAYDSNYMRVNEIMDSIEFEDISVFTIGDSSYLPSEDGIHLNYFGISKVGKSIYNEVINPTTKRVMYPKGNIREIDSSGTLNITDYDETLIINGSSPINYTIKRLCKDGRNLTLWRKQSGPGITIRNNFGDQDIYAQFVFSSGENTPLTAGTAIRFKAHNGKWHQIKYLS